MRYPKTDEILVAEWTPKGPEIGEQRVVFLREKDGWAHPYKAPLIALDVMLPYVREKYPDTEWQVWVETFTVGPLGEPGWTCDFGKTGELYCKILEQGSLWLKRHPCPYADRPAVVEGNS